MDFPLFDPTGVYIIGIGDRVHLGYFISPRSLTCHMRPHTAGVLISSKIPSIFPYRPVAIYGCVLRTCVFRRLWCFLFMGLFSMLRRVLCFLRAGGRFLFRKGQAAISSLTYCGLITVARCIFIFSSRAIRDCWRVLYFTVSVFFWSSPWICSIRCA